MITTIEATPSELMDMGLWEEYCEDQGINPWIVKEGLMKSDHKITWIKDSREAEATAERGYKAPLKPATGSSP